MNEFKVERKAVKVHGSRFTIICLIFALPVLCRGEVAGKSSQVRNGSFNARGVPQEQVEKLRQAGWKCPDAAEWPQSWGLIGNPGTVEFPRTNGVQGDGYARLTGTNTLTGYHGLPLEERNYIYTIWARGKGNLRFHVLSWGKDEKGNPRQLVKENEGVVGKTMAVDSKEWVRYRHLLVKTPALLSMTPWPWLEGELDIDEVDITPSTPALDLIVVAEGALYGSGALIEDQREVKADDTFKEKVKLYQEAVAGFRQAKAVDKDLAASIVPDISSTAMESEKTSGVKW